MVRILSGPALAGLLYAALPSEYAPPAGGLEPLTDGARLTICALAWMAAWWILEPVHLSVTALIPAVFFPLLGVAKVKQACAPYASDTVFLFMGGFMLALAMQKHGLDRRIALAILTRVGTKPSRMVGAIMLVTAVFSAFVSNTATAAMMLPIGLSLLGLVAGNRASPADMSTDHRHFASALLIGIAYAASIGGLATLIGTPPNMLLKGYLAETIAEPLRINLSFADWMKVGVPAVLLFLPPVWFLLTRVLHPVKFKEIPGGQAFLHDQQLRLGPAGRAEWATLTVFVLAVTAWLLMPAIKTRLPAMSDASVALLAAFALFLIPADGKGTPVLDWATASALPWGILILFGGGLSLADAMEQHGVARFLAAQSLGLHGIPPWLIVLLLCTSVAVLSEFASNTAVAAALLPILGGMAPALGMHPYELLIPATLAASCGFMLPIATPPNTLLYGTGYLRSRDLLRAGVWTDLLGILLSTVLGRWFATWLISASA